MKIVLLGFATLFVSEFALAQVCDVTWTAESETMSGSDAGNGSFTMPAMPKSEVDFYHERSMKQLDALSKEQDKCKRDADHCYRVDVFEDRACDGGAKVRQPVGQGSGA